ncbi:SAM-dependent methyltransferase, partial [Enterococcus faecalis]
LEQRIQEIFGSHEIKQNQHTVIYELIVISCKKTTSDY